MTFTFETFRVALSLAAPGQAFVSKGLSHTAFPSVRVLATHPAPVVREAASVAMLNFGMAWAGIVTIEDMRPCHADKKHATCVIAVGALFVRSFGGQSDFAWPAEKAVAA